MEQPVRKPYEGDPETLENLMNRMLTDHRGSTISWFQLLSFFSRRGKPSAEMHALHACTSTFKDNLDILKKGELSEAQKFQLKKDNLSRKLNQTLGYKQELIPKTGKGNYNVTVPIPYKFDQREKERSKTKTIRERKVEQMIQEKF